MSPATIRLPHPSTVPSSAAPQNQPRSRRKVEARIVAVYITFWAAWLVFDHASGYGLGPLTTGLVVLSFAAFAAGRLLPKRNRPISLPAAPVHQRMSRLLRFVVLLNGVLLAWAVPSILNHGFDHRSLMFTDEGVFGHIGLTFFYNYAVQPLNYAAVVLAMVTSTEAHRYGRYAYLILTMMAIMALGRFPIYFIIYFYVVSHLMEVRPDRPQLGKTLRVGAIVAVVVFVAWQLLTSKLKEEGADIDDLGTILRLYLLNYHVVGYHMLDYIIYAQDSRVGDYLFPTTSAGVVGWVLHLVTKYSAVLPVFPNSFKDVMEIFNQGIFLPELDWAYNAFTTSILPFYADGGVIGVVLGYGLLGRLSTHGRRLQNQFVSPVFLMVCFVLTFSLFQPLAQAELPLNLLFLFLCNQYLLRGETQLVPLSRTRLLTSQGPSA